MDPFIISVTIVVLFVILASLRVINEYERGVKFTLGRSSGIMGPGLNIVIPIIQSYQKVDMRTRVIDVPTQESITKDNITVGINAVLYYSVFDAKLAVMKVENYDYAVSQLAQTTMRNVVGEVELDGLLSKREEIAKKIREIVDKISDPWGVKVEAVDLKDITLPQEMKRVIGRQAEAERDRRAVVIKAEGERMAAENMSKAASILSKVPGAMNLRTLNAINDLSSDQSNTVVFAVPVEVLEGFKRFSQKK
jgi:regulator of protease activity HflC (stomatin/prohibitin superfamily)